MEKTKKVKKSLSDCLWGLSHEETADMVLHLMRKEDQLILNLCDDSHPDDALGDIVCQHIAERGLKEILDTIKSEPINSTHLYAGSVLVAIKDLHIVKKYLWKDKQFLNGMENFLQFARKEDAKEFLLLRDIVAHVIQGTLLGGTPSSYTEMVSKSELVELYIDIFKHKHEVKSNYSYEEFLLSLLVLCQSNTLCIQKCSNLLISSVLKEFSQWSELDVNIKDKTDVTRGCIQHMVSQESLPEHKKLLLSKFSEHIHSKNKSCSRLETVVCSNPECLKVQPADERFKKCGRCRVVLYCSKDCQLAHWKIGHSKVCVSPS